MSTFSPGSLVRCREREWVVLPSESDEVLLLRPIGGGEHEITGIARSLSRTLALDTITPAQFPPPDIAQPGDVISGRLLSDATRLTFRSGAGPFRSLGRISVRPRPFQIVPLLMALRLEWARLLIADDVGIGKTIEAALIARELLDRGDAQRLCVLCPPHLCDQWHRELRDKFSIETTVVRAGTLARLERDLPRGDVSVFEHYRHLVVSIDFVKSDRRRDSFLRSCPDLLIVDEAHTAARATGRSMIQQRHDLLQDLARDTRRHLLLLTATPHSGIEDAFRSLLELLDPAFARFDLSALSEQQRRRMARHFVQRRRPDVQRWLGDDDETPFPTRDTREITYKLAASPAYATLSDNVRRFAQELVLDHSGDTTAWRRRVRYWTALALLRCVMSSPAAAQTTLQARLGRLADQADTELIDTQTFAGYILDLSEQEQTQDFEPTPVIETGEAHLGSGERQRLQRFVRQAAKLYGDDDPKLLAAIDEITTMLDEGFSPIIYCRYIATADYVASELRKRIQKRWPNLHIISVTGVASEEEREQRVAELANSPRRVLVATDCLSEGINLQFAFDAVLHYDLPWNPNRLEQREGRVDRYGQPAPIVRTTLLYGVDNQIDEAVLTVLIRKAKSIRHTLGISVPLPVDSASFVETVVQSLFQEQVEQLALFDDTPSVNKEQLHEEWDRAAEREKESRSRFAQHAIKPEEVAQELYESDTVLGNPATVAAFVQDACARLGVPLTSVANHQRRSQAHAPAVWQVPLAELPEAVWERVSGAPDSMRIGFDMPLPEDVHLIGRLHPLTEALAEHLFGLALEGSEPLTVSRCGAIRTTSVSRRTTLLLLRLRLLIETSRAVPLLAEELIVAGFEGRPGNLVWLAEEDAQHLLNTTESTGNIATTEIGDVLRQTSAYLDELKEDLERLAQERAAALLAAHRRVRQTTRMGQVRVRPHLPLDVLAMYVLLPVPKGQLSEARRAV